MYKLIFKVRNLKKAYNSKIVLDVDKLNFQEGKIYAIVGPNGSGKTTLLNILNLLEKPDEGQIFFYDQEITNKSNSNTLEIRRRMTLVNQDPFLFHSTVYNNIAYGLKIRSIPSKVQKSRIRSALNIVGLSGFKDRKADQLSGGEAQRGVIARALVIEPEVLFLDEPTANIDQKHVDVVERIIKKIKKEIKTTVIFTTHDLSQAYRLADEVISLLDGKIIKQVPENLLWGEIIEEDGLKRFKTTGDIKFTIVSEKVGPVYISIDPRDIILSYEQFQSSARNSFLGKITKIIEQNHLVKLEIDIGIPLVVIITGESFLKMNLNLGNKVYLTFKASAVKLY
ncbi:ATP-binding cassette domain-containing protein [Candidatus Atribacteria bacterium 1244-E10-H5-B2]|nr:MAG: ATP-binding cassette domain-containing protein [Candidatus Atribacteria bacterium 1244-E10-H5-B2]